jgi:hypothetical protein
VITISGFRNASAESGATTIVSPCVSCFDAYWDDALKTLKLQILSNLEPLQAYTVSFNLTNPSRGQSPPALAIVSSGVVMASNTSCKAFSARILTSDGTRAAPLAVTTARFLIKNIGQSNPYPGGENIVSITISTNVPLFVQSRTIVNMTYLNVSGLQGAVFDKTVPLYANTQYLTDYSSSSAIFFAPTLDDAVYSGSPSIILHLLRPTQDGANYSLKFNTTNQIRGQSSPAIFISCVGILIDAVRMDPDNTSVLSDLPGTVMGDAAPLKIYTPLFRLKNIGQSNPFPAAMNVISVTISFNVNLRKSCALYSSWRFLISNLIGGPATAGCVFKNFKFVSPELFLTNHMLQ